MPRARSAPAGRPAPPNRPPPASAVAATVAAQRAPLQLRLSVVTVEHDARARTGGLPDRGIVQANSMPSICTTSNTAVPQRIGQRRANASLCSRRAISGARDVSSCRAAVGRRALGHGDRRQDARQLSQARSIGGAVALGEAEQGHVVALGPGRAAGGSCAGWCPVAADKAVAASGAECGPCVASMPGDRAPASPRPSCAN
jgi:hypothetical protein